MLDFEFFEHMGTVVTVEITRFEGPLGPRYRAALSDDPSVSFDAPESAVALAQLKQHVTRPGSGPNGAEPPRGKRPARQLHGPGSVLVVDDNPASVRLAGSVIELLGHWAIGARDGHEAFQWLQQRPIDLVLTDLHMPGLGGVAFVKMLRATAGGRDLPVIGITGAGPNGIKSLRDAGVDEIVRKPYEAKQLILAIQGLLVPISR